MTKITISFKYDEEKERALKGIALVNKIKKVSKIYEKGIHKKIYVYCD